MFRSLLRHISSSSSCAKVTNLELGRWRHVKTGEQVIAFTRSRCEASGGLCITYVKIKDDQIWTRSEQDFREKFELLETSLVLNHKLNLPGVWNPHHT